MKNHGMFAFWLILLLFSIFGLQLLRHGCAAGKASAMSQHGINIYNSLTIDEYESGLWPRDMGINLEINCCQPKWLDAKSSTEFFYHYLSACSDGLTVNGGKVRRVSLLDLSAGLVKTSKSLDQFSATNNAWIVVKNRPDKKIMPKVPILISKNLDVRTFASHYAPAFHTNEKIAFERSFNFNIIPKYGVIVYNDGSVVQVKNRARFLRWSTIYNNQEFDCSIGRKKLKYLTPVEEVDYVLLPSCRASVELAE